MTEQQADFVLAEDPTVQWPVTVALPADGGKVAEYRFLATIRVLPESGYEELLGNPPEESSLAEILARNAELLPQLVVGWSGPKTSQGIAVPFSAETLVTEIKGPRGRALSAGLWRAVHEVRFGAALGNSEPSPAAGPN